MKVSFGCDVYDGSMLVTTHGGRTHGGASMVVRYGGSIVETHGAGGTYPISQTSILPSPVIHTDLSILLFISNRKRFHLSKSDTRQAKHQARRTRSKVRAANVKQGQPSRAED